jgi:hypothetical protein
MRNLIFALVFCFCGHAMAQTPVPDPLTTQSGQTFGNLFRLCVEIQADIDAADMAAGAAKRHLEECQGAYRYAVIQSMEAAADFAASGYLDPLAVIRANYWAGQVAWYAMRVSSAESALNSAIGRLTVFEMEYAVKGCH